MRLTITDIYRGDESIFFGDQQLYSQDLNNIEYTKIKTLRDSLKAFIKTPGVAIDSLSSSSLKVEYVDSKHFTVNPGTAIDKFGRLIYVPTNPSSGSGSISTDPYYHPIWPNRENLLHNQLPEELTTYYVVIYYTTQQDIDKKNDSGIRYYTREYDSYIILVENIAPDKNSVGLCLASFLVDTNGNIVSSGSISDLRPLLSLAFLSPPIPTAREIYRRDQIVFGGGYLSPDFWSVDDSTAQIKAFIMYRWNEETLIDTYFTVPIGSVAGFVQISIMDYTTIIFTSSTYSFSSGIGSYNFSDILPNLSKDKIYYMKVEMSNTAPGTAMIDQIVINVH
jgi:hypothetical protein